jgi:hypothetical protein
VSVELPDVPLENDPAARRRFERIGKWGPEVVADRLARHEARIAEIDRILAKEGREAAFAFVMRGPSR